ncbi:DUF222 domain-containing protein [Candidatus Palauibacter sp.]|uniref:HNH endonuclease signature motif containing protein n=1 Tax=Candidatus Palauibacter sp. TaxID=3101350 RepID=UPI003B0248E1
MLDTHAAASDPLGDEIAELCAHIDAGQYRLLTLLHVFDREERWSGWRSCAHWLSWRTGISTGPARERVRVARRLASLPLTAAEMKKGRLSWSKVRALTRIATPENEERLVDFALRHTASQVERFVRAQRSAEAAAAGPEAEPAARRYVSVRVGKDGMYRISGRLVPEIGALLVKALDTAGDELHRQEGAAEEEVHTLRETGRRHHDALAMWLEERTSAAVQLVVHTVAGEPDVVATEDGSHVPAGTSRRLLCDAEAVRVERGPDGSVLDVGRRTRTVHWRLRKALEVRDRGCRFPGCGSRHTQAHHVIPWAEGGKTSLDNLILLCRFHHRWVHEGGWRVEMDPAGEAGFRDPEGSLIPGVPPAAEDVKAPATTDAGIARWHRQKGINSRTATEKWEREPLQLGRLLWVLWGQAA